MNHKPVKVYTHENNILSLLSNKTVLIRFSSIDMFLIFKKICFAKPHLKSKEISYHNILSDYNNRVD